MDYKATLLVLVLVSSALAGCTGDPDGGGMDEVDSDALQDLFDEHFQDFINNTTITVNNHYYNNTTYVVDDGDYSTTVVNEYNNTTINEGDETSTNNYNNQTENDYSALNYSFGGVAGGNGSGGGTLYLLDIQFTLADLMPDWAEIDHRNNTIDYAYTYYDYLTNSERTDVFTINCIDYYLVGSQSNNNSSQVSYWQDSGNYWDAWVDQYNQTIANMLQEAAYSHYGSNTTGDYGYHVRLACDEDYDQDGGFDDLLLFEIPIPAGVALSGFYDNYFQGLEEYVWMNEHHTDVYMNGDYTHYWSGDMEWRTTYSPINPSDNWGLHSAFSVDFEFETMSWSYVYGGWVGGDEDSMLSVSVDNIYPGYEYRLIAYFTMAPVVPLE
jgi:hypothetical protein